MGEEFFGIGNSMALQSFFFEKKNFQKALSTFGKKKK